MDIAAVLADKALLATLSREYELLKATNADVDWQQWIKARLQRAAAKHSSSNRAVSQQRVLGAVQHQQQQQQLHQSEQQQHRPPIRPSVSLRTPSKTPARLPASRSAGNSRRSSAVDGDSLQATPLEETGWRAQDVTNTQPQPTETQRPTFLRLHSGGTSALQKQVLPPHGQGPAAATGQPHLAPPYGFQPQWVAAARLGTALQASRVVPTMHAAAAREQRLTAAAAVARQQLDMGLGPDAAACMMGGEQQQQQLPPAAQEQLQQVVRLTQEVVEQNQLLQQAMQQQQAQLSQHQGLLAAVLQHSSTPTQPTDLSPPAIPPALPLPQATSTAGAGMAAVSTAAGAQQQQTVAGAGDAAAASSGDQLLHNQIKDSWLVKTLLQQQQPGSSTKPGAAAAAAAAPEFIRIAGAARQQPKRLTSDQQQQAAGKQQPPEQGTSAGAAATSPAAGSAAAGHAGSPPPSAAAAADRRIQLKSVLRQLLTQGAVGPLPGGLAGLVAGLKGLQQTATAEKHQVDTPAKQSQAAAASLVALLQQQQQQQQGGQRTAQLSKAQQLVLQRRKAQQEQEEQQRLQQQQEGALEGSGGKPGWQSEVYVPPPSRMLRVKKGGAADVWNAPPTSPPQGTARPQTSQAAAATPQPPRRKAQKQAGRGAQSKAAAGRRGKGSSSRSGKQNLASVLYGSRWRVDGGLKQQQQQQQQQQRYSQDEMLDVTFGAWQSEGQSLEQHTRLSQVEETSYQALEAVRRLEQHMTQQQQPAPPAAQAALHGASGEQQCQDAIQLQDPAALDSLLAALERVERQEQEIHDRWFGGGSGSSSGEGGGSCGEGAGRSAAADAGAVAGSAKQLTDQQEGPCLSAHADAPCSSTPAYNELAPKQQAPVMLLQQDIVVQQQQQEDACALSASAVRSIKASRQKFLHHQARLDGTLHELGSGNQLGPGSKPGSRTRGDGGGSSRRSVLQPQQVVEAVADLLLDELVGAEAEELEGFCDVLCDQLVEAEFADA